MKVGYYLINANFLCIYIELVEISQFIAETIHVGYKMQNYKLFASMNNIKDKTYGGCIM